MMKLSKSRLTKDIDTISAKLGIKYSKEDLAASLLSNSFKLFLHEGQFSCLISLLDPVLVSSSPEPRIGPSSALPIFSFSFKAHKRRTKSSGTTNRYTLQFLKDTSYELLSQTKEGLALRGGFPRDPSACSHFLQCLQQKAQEALKLSTDSYHLIFESRPLTAIIPDSHILFKEIKRKYEDELFLVLRIPTSFPSPASSFLPSDNTQVPLSINGWSGLLAQSVEAFKEFSTLHPLLLDEALSFTIQ